MFIITEHKENTISNKMIASGFQMTFENGNTISIQFGFGTYSSNRKESKEYAEKAEIQIWNKEGNEFKFDDRLTLGWVNSNEVAKWIEFASKNLFE